MPRAIQRFWVLGVAVAPWLATLGGAPLASPRAASGLTFLAGEACMEGGGGGAPLPLDPAVVSGRLENGLTYVIRPHAGSPGRLALRLVVNAGSLSEPDHAPGAAALCATMLEHAGADEPAGRALTALIQQGRDISVERVVTDYETSTFTLVTPASDAAAVKTALWRLSEIAQGGGLPVARLTDLRTRAQGGAGEHTLAERLTRAVVPQLLPGSRVADHLPHPAEEQVCALTIEALQAFLADRYTPANMTLVAVGDAEPHLIETLIVRIFDALPAAPAPAPPVAAWVAPPAGPRVIVATDIELRSPVVELTVIDLPGGPVATECDLRRRLVETLATHTLEQRLRALMDAGDAPFAAVDVWSGDIPGAMHMTAATVSGDLRQVRQLVERLCREVAHARYEGVSERRLADARAQALSEAEQLAGADAASDVLAALDRLTRVSRHGSAHTSPAQRLALMQRLASTITAEEVADALGERFDLERCALVVLAPAGPWAPTAAMLRPMVEETLASLPTEALSDDAPMTLVSGMPVAGVVEEVTIHPPSGVTSVWLSNGVRAHHRVMDANPGSIAVTVTIAGGRIEETEEQRGLTQATMALWRMPASNTRSAADIRRLLLSQPVRLSAIVGDDGIRLSATCSRRDLEAGMQLLHLLLTEPVIEAPAFQRWRWATIREIESRRDRPLSALRSATAAALYAGDDPRRPPLEADEVRALQRGAVQTWLDRLVLTAPIEVGVAGDVSREEALELAARYLGSLAARDRPGEQTFCELRRPAARPLPGVYRITAPSESDGAVALVGLRGADPHDGRSRVLLDLAARCISHRLHQACVGRGRLASHIFAQHVPAEAYPGDGLLYVLGHSDPGAIDQLAQTMNQEVSAVTQGDLSSEALEAARAEALRDLDLRLSDPSYWAWTLSSLTYHGEDIDEILSRREQTQRATPADVTGALALHDGARGPDGHRLTVIVTPVEPSPPFDNLATTRPPGR